MGLMDPHQDSRNSGDFITKEQVVEEELKKCEGKRRENEDKEILSYYTHGAVLKMIL